MKFERVQTDMIFEKLRIAGLFWHAFGKGLHLHIVW